MTGRPSSYTEAKAEAICERLASGHSLREICRAEDMPHISTVFRWMEANEGFRERYARAREAQAHNMADELLEIADDARNDWMDRAKEDGTVDTVLNSEHVQRSRLRVDSRKWLLSKMLPKVYGDKVQTEGPGPNGEHTTRVVLDWAKPAEPDPTEP